MTPNVLQLATVRQLAGLYPAFSEASIRWLIFKAKENGLDPALVHIGRRVLIDVPRFGEWVNSQRSKAA